MDSTVQRGQNLCKEIEAAYASFKAAKTTKCCVGPDLTSLVTKHIPVGSSFDVAESILRNAGFTVDDGGGMLQLGSRFPCGHKLVVDLSPRAPVDYSVIDKVHAEIVIVCP